MKQQWRIVQIRVIWSLFYGILILAYAYFGYMPLFAHLGAVGPFAFAATIFFAFLIIGYIYDRVLLMWAASHEVTQERNPYQYVPSPREHIFWFPLYSTLLDACEALAKKHNLDTSVLQETKEYYANIRRLRPERSEDIDTAIELRDEYLANHKMQDLLPDE